MGTTADSWTVGGALNVTGATTLTAAVTCSSTLGVTDTLTCTAAATVGTNFNAGLSAAAYNTTYSWVKIDGTNPPTMQTMRLYDWGSGTWKKGTLTNGTLAWA